MTDHRLRIEPDPKFAPPAKAGEVVPPGGPGDTGIPGGAHRLRIEDEPVPVWKQILELAEVDPMVPKGYIEIRDADGVLLSRHKIEDADV